MKFVALALSAALMGFSANSAEATRLSGKYTSDQKFTSKLMQNARLYDSATGAAAAAVQGDRKLDQNNANTITAAHSIVFKSCESLTCQPDFEDDGDDDGSVNIQTLYSQGAVRSQKSYILFDVCLSDYCYSGKSSDRTTYITDMASFIQAFYEFIPTKQAEYCTGCQNNFNYCYNLSNNNSYNNSSANDGGRKLAQNGGVVEYIDCNRCKSYGCFSGNNNADYSAEWISAMTSCQADNDNPYYYNGKQVTTGFMCNEEGTGVEVAAFLDDECTLYTNQIAYGNMMSQQEYAYWSSSRQHIEYMFNTGFSCYDPEVTYINPYDEAAGTYGDDVWGDDGAAAGDDGQVPEAAEWCQNAFAGNMQPITLADCGGYYSNNNNNNNGGRRKLDGTNAYSQQYTLAEEDIEDAYAVCNALTGLGGQGEHLYNKTGSGSMYKYYGATKENSRSWEDSESSKSKMGGKATGAITFFVIVVLAGMGVAAGMYLKNKKELESATIDGKEAPLVSDSDKGQMA